MSKMKVILELVQRSVVIFNEEDVIFYTHVIDFLFCVCICVCVCKLVAATHAGNDWWGSTKWRVQEGGGIHFFVKGFCLKKFWPRRNFKPVFKYWR